MKLPTKRELNDLRLGQAIYNALSKHFETSDKETLMDMLYELDGDEIEVLLKQDEWEPVWAGDIPLEEVKKLLNDKA